jgi:Eukaryotic cytochrome b561
LIFISLVLLVAGIAILSPNAEAMYSTHGLLGIALLVGILVQIVLGVKSARVKCEDLKNESTFEAGHKNLAKLIIAGGIVNIYLGFDVLKNDAYVIGGYTGWLLLLVVFVVYLEWKRGRASRYTSNSLFKPSSGILGSKSEKPNPYKDSKSPFMYRPSWNKQGGNNDSLIIETLVKARNNSNGPRPVVKVVASGGTPVPKSRQSSPTRPSLLAEKSPSSPAMLAERIGVLDKLTQKLLDSRKLSTSSVPHPVNDGTGNNSDQSPSTPVVLPLRTPSPLHGGLVDIDLHENGAPRVNVGKKKGFFSGMIGK